MLLSSDVDYITLAQSKVQTTTKLSRVLNFVFACIPRGRLYCFTHSFLVSSPSIFFLFFVYGVFFRRKTHLEADGTRIHWNFPFSWEEIIGIVFLGPFYSMMQGY